jgi:hypothetical protein
MPLNVTTQHLPGYVSVKITGPASLDDFVGLIATVGTQTRQRGDKRVLVDLLGVEGDMKFTEHFQLGSQAAQHLRHLERMASVVPEDKITRTSEKVALKQGFQLRVFTSMGEALEWLLQAPAQPSTITRDLGTDA